MKTTQQDGPAESEATPGNAIVGEGKPEGLNHAVVFAKGGFTVLDMNQAVAEKRQD